MALGNYTVVMNDYMADLIWLICFQSFHYGYITLQNIVVQYQFYVHAHLIGNIRGTVI